MVAVLPPPIKPSRGRALVILIDPSLSPLGTCRAAAGCSLQAEEAEIKTKSLLIPWSRSEKRKEGKVYDGAHPPSPSPSNTTPLFVRDYVRVQSPA